MQNTVLGVLAADHGILDPKPVHRLDIGVSGLLIMATTAAAANVFREAIQGNAVSKVYVARVKGMFLDPPDGNSAVVPPSGFVRPR